MTIPAGEPFGNQGRERSSSTLPLPESSAGGRGESLTDSGWALWQCRLPDESLRNQPLPGDDRQLHSQRDRHITTRPGSTVNLLDPRPSSHPRKMRLQGQRRGPRSPSSGRPAHGEQASGQQLSQIQELSGPQPRGTPAPGAPSLRLGRLVHERALARVAAPPSLQPAVPRTPGRQEMPLV